MTTKNNNSVNVSRYETVIGSGLVIKGELKEINSDGNIRVEGKIEGPVTIEQKLLTIEGSSIVGNINANIAEIGGVVNGDIEANYVILLSTARVTGNITTTFLETKQGCFFEGKTIMSKVTNGE